MKRPRARRRIHDEGRIRLLAGRVHLARSSQVPWLFCFSSRRIGLHVCSLLRFLEGANPLAPPQSGQLTQLGIALSGIRHNAFCLISLGRSFMDCLPVGFFS